MQHLSIQFCIASAYVAKRAFPPSSPSVVIGTKTGEQLTQRGREQKRPSAAADFQLTKDQADWTRHPRYPWPALPGLAR